MLLVCLVWQCSGFFDNANDNDDYCLGKQNGRYPHPDGCHEFYYCLRNNTHAFKCQGKKKYSTTKRRCTYDTHVDCGTRPKNRKAMKKLYRSRRSVVTKGCNHCKRIVCYFTNWSHHRIGAGRYLPSNVNATLCTHVIFAYAKLENNHLKPTDDADLPNSQDELGAYKRIVNLKKVNKDLKVLLSVGGRDTMPTQFMNMVSSNESRSMFIDNAIQYLRNHSFDGLELHFNHFMYIKKEQSYLFSRLVRQFRQAFDQEALNVTCRKLILTLAVMSGINLVDHAYHDVPGLSLNVDFISVMPYDYDGIFPIDNKYNFSPQVSDVHFQRILMVKKAIEYWANQGVSRSKLLVALVMYSRTITAMTGNYINDECVTKTLQRAGDYTGHAGINSYYELCLLHRRVPELDDFFDERLMIEYLFLNDTWIGYDNVKSVSAKTRYAIDNHFGGIFIWDISLDDFTGQSCNRGGPFHPYPLLTTAFQVCHGISGS